MASPRGSAHACPHPSRDAVSNLRAGGAHSVLHPWDPGRGPAAGGKELRELGKRGWRWIRQERADEGRGAEGPVLELMDTRLLCHGQQDKQTAPKRRVSYRSNSQSS